MNLVFNSYGFVFLFLPLTVGGYTLAEHIWSDKETLAGVRRLLLTAASVLYMASFGLRSLLIFLCSISVTIVFSLLLRRFHSKILLTAALVLQVGALVYFKYAGVLTGSRIALPLAVSFYTFSQISWLVDLYRREPELENWTVSEYLTYITFFPKLLQGPITRFAEMKPHLDRLGDIRFDVESFTRGFLLFLLGLFEKVILADTLNVPVDYAYSHLNAIRFAEAWIITVAYPLSLYLDFSAYCNMGRGVARMLGMDLPENFDKPYRSVNGSELWGRWHSSLNRFFVRYIYIPLGGSRRGNARTLANMMLVFVISGLWHGSTWYFLVWGCMNGILATLTWAWIHIARPAIRGKLSHSRNSEAVTAATSTEPDHEPDHKTGASLVSRILHGIRTAFCVLFMDLWLSVTFMIFHGPDSASVLAMVRKLLTPQPLRVAEYFATQFELSELWYLIKITPLSHMPYSRYYLMWIMLIGSWACACLLPKARTVSEKIKINAFTGFVFSILFVWCVLALGKVTEFAYFAF
ncbi:MAG: MBOAT family protein [Lachnospiraceae bacterium]|nr:MBOAT family protein [Lachnospiraceae bacterium]